MSSSEPPHSNSSSHDLPVVVIGAGPVGIDFCRKLSAESTTPIVLYGDESFAPYNRVKLSLYLSGQAGQEDLFYDLGADEQFQSDQITLKQGVRVVAINPVEKTITDSLGDVQSYRFLVMATGAQSYTPQIKGMDCRGVYTFRDMRDADHLLARLGRSHHTVVVGAGLLGLEIAQGLNRYGTKITVLDMNAWPMFRQLNEKAAGLVSQFYESSGITIQPNELVKEIISDSAGRLQGYISSHQNEMVKCDTLVFATGAKPNVELAQESGLICNDGIVVNGFLQTSDRSIYAIGDCAEFDNQYHGIVSPGYDQASIAVNHMLGRAGEYRGADFTTVLKVSGIDVFCAGSEQELHRPGAKVYEYEDAEQGIYRCVMTAHNRIVYAVGIGEWPEASRIAESITSKRWVLFHKFFQFKRSGNLFSEEESSIAYWPDNAVVCHCMNVSRGTLSQSVMRGHITVESLQKETQACTVCGSCQPKLVELIEVESGDAAKKSAAAYAPVLLGLGLLSLLWVLVSWFAAAIPASNTSLEGAYDQIWLDGLYKQITGFTLLGLSLLAMSLAMSKRYVAKLKKWFRGMRAVHVLLGFLTILVLWLHTGNHQGEGLNQWLLVDFLAVILLGGVMAVWLSMEHKVPSFWGSRLRKVFGWTHILAVWFLPVLLSFHVLSVYYF